MTLWAAFKSTLLILSSDQEFVFQSAARYANLGDVENVISDLMDNPVEYQNLIESAYAFLEKNHGHAVHRERLLALGVSSGLQG